MSQPSANNQSLSFRLAVTNFVLVTVVLVTLIATIAWGINRSILSNAHNSLRENMSAMRSFVEATDKSARHRVHVMLDAFAAMLPQTAELASETDGTTQLLLGGEPVSNDDRRFATYITASGATAVIYARQGADFFRVASNFVDAQGKPMVGTTFTRSQSPEFFDRIASGQSGDTVFILGGKKYIGAYSPIKNAKGEHIATIFAGLLFEEVIEGVRDAVRSTKVGESGYYFVINAKEQEPSFGTLAAHPVASNEGKNMLDAATEDGRTFVRDMISQKKGLIDYTWLDPQSNTVRTKFAAFDTYEPWGWMFASSVYEDELTAGARQIIWLLAVLGVVALVLLTGVWTYIIKGQIVRPLVDAARITGAVAQGDLTVRATVKRMDEVGQLLHSINQTTAGLADVITTVRTRAQAVALASAEIAQGNQDLSNRTEAQAGALQETASAMEQLGSTVSNNAENAKSADSLTQEAQRVVTEGGIAVREVVQTMQGIDASSKKIADIIGVIDGIAFQTNILALNAAVEAARAGEHGRGFAVVAGEVRSLAGRSAEAAKEIKQLINASVQEIEQGNIRAARAGETMEQAMSEIQKVTTLISDISHASVEQSNGVSQAAEAVNQMDQTTQQNAAMVEEMAAAASNLRQQSDELMQAVNIFRVSGSFGSGAHLPPSAPKSSAAPKKPATGLSASATNASAPARSSSAAGLPAPASSVTSSAAAPSASATSSAAPSSAARKAAPAAAPSSPPAPAPRKSGSAPAAAGSEDDWESF